MSTNALARIKVGSAPDSWGVWFPDDPVQVPWQRFLDELTEAGYKWLELGPYGYLPTDPKQLLDEVDARGLNISAGTVFGAMHHPDDWATDLESARQVAELTRAVGGRYLVFLPFLYRDVMSGKFVEPTTLDATGWRRLVTGLNELGKIIFSDYGIKLVFHPHADSHVETQEQIERLLTDTDPDHVSLCLDTGHVAYKGGDNVALLRKYPERIDYVHFKQMDPTILQRVESENLGFGDAVRLGVACEPPQGVPSVESIADALEPLDADIFVVVEQDLYPCDPDVPLPIASRTRQYLRRCGLGAADLGGAR